MLLFYLVWIINQSLKVWSDLVPRTQEGSIFTTLKKMFKRNTYMDALMWRSTLQIWCANSNTCVNFEKARSSNPPTYSRRKNGKYPPISWFTFWSVQPKSIIVWKQMIYHWKPYKIATRNAKKNFEFSKICKIFRAFFEKAVFLENGRGRH